MCMICDVILDKPACWIWLQICKEQVPEYYLSDFIIIRQEQTCNKCSTLCKTWKCRYHRNNDEELDKLEMWANAQRDGRPAEYRWRPLFNAAKFAWCPLLECRAVTLPRRETRWNLQVCPILANRSQPLVGRSSPYYQDMWRRYRRLTSFFPIIDTCLSSEDIAQQSCAMVPKTKMYFQRATCSTFHTCILNMH